MIPHDWDDQDKKDKEYEASHTRDIIMDYAKFERETKASITELKELMNSKFEAHGQNLIDLKDDKDTADIYTELRKMARDIEKLDKKLYNKDWWGAIEIRKNNERIEKLEDSLQKCGVKWDFVDAENRGFIDDLKQHLDDCSNRVQGLHEQYKEIADLKTKFDVWRNECNTMINDLKEQMRIVDISLKVDGRDVILLKEVLRELTRIQMEGFDSVDIRHLEEMLNGEGVKSVRLSSSNLEELPSDEITDEQNRTDSTPLHQATVWSYDTDPDVQPTPEPVSVMIREAFPELYDKYGMPIKKPTTEVEIEDLKWLLSKISFTRYGDRTKYLEMKEKYLSEEK